MADTGTGVHHAAGTLELLLQVLRGEPEAIEYVPTHLEQRAVALGDKPSQSSSSTAPPPSLKFNGPELIPGSRDALVPGASRSSGAAVSSSDRGRAGGSNVLRGAGTTVAEAQASPDRRSSQGDRRGGQQRQPMSTLGQSRSTSSLQQSGSGIVSSSRRGGSQLVPSRPTSGGGGRTIYEDLDRAYSGPGSTPDLNFLKDRLSAVIDSKGSSSKFLSKERTAKPSSADMGSTASTMAPREKPRTKEMVLAGQDTPLTSRSDASEFLGDNAFALVNDIVDTCVDLEHVRSTLARTDPRFGGTMRPASNPSDIWCARAALAAAASAEAASAAAEVAAAASAEAAREAAKCSAAAKAATGRYNGLVDYVMSGRSSYDVTMKPSGLPALEAPVATADVTQPGRPSPSTSEGKPAKPGPASVVDNKARSGFSDSEDEGDPKKKDGDDDRDHSVDQAKMEKEEHKSVKPALSVDSQVGLREFQVAAGLMDLDAEEAKNMFSDICEEKNEPFAENLTFKMHEYLEELKIHDDDNEAVAEFCNKLLKAREQIKANQASSGQVGDAATIRQCFDKIVRHLAWQNIPVKDSWKMLEKMKKSNKDHTLFSKAELAVIASFERREKKFVEKVQAFNDQPPTLCSSAGQQATKEICIKQVNDIIEKCKADGTQFTDPDFDLKSNLGQCFYVDKEQPGYDCTVGEPSGVKRLTTIVKKAMRDGGGGAMGALGGMFGGMGGGGKKKDHKPAKPLVFKGEVKPGDVVQGQIGTCFLLGAIGAMACHRAKGITKMFIKYDVDVGVYGIRFCVDGEWTFVIVDDWMPVDCNGDLLFARCKDPQEVWVPLLEKAFCKLHTCYEMCDGGEATEALNAFFGGVTGKLAIQKQHHSEPEKFFKLLQNARDKGWLLATSFVKQPGQKAAGSGKCGEDMLPCGLVGGHAYSILKIVEASGEQLVQCRNPWGTGEWTGKWSDKNEFGEWTPAIKKAVGYTNADDGKFWMSCQDFVNNSGGVDYARTFGPQWKKATQYARFADCTMVVTAKRNCKAKGPNALAFKKGDLIKVAQMQGEIFWGNLKSDRSGQMKGFPGRYVKFGDRPVLRFDIVATRNEGSNDPVTAVVMLMQQNVIMQRKYKMMEEVGMNYKDLDYAQIELIIVNPQGEVAVRKLSSKRCVWGEIEMPGGGQWKVYALCTGAKGSPCCVRTYLKGGSLSFKEVKGCKFSEVAPFIFDD